MATSKTEVANLALFKIGQNPITSLTEGSKASVLINTIFNQCLGVVLERYAWSFATKRAACAKLDVTLAWGDEDVYQLPSNYLRLVELNNQWVVGDGRLLGGNEKAYTIEGNTMLNSMGSANIRYVAFEDNIELYPPTFVDALAAYIAKEIAKPITGDSNDRLRAEELFNISIKTAKMTQAIQLPPASLPDTSILTNREY